MNPLMHVMHCINANTRSGLWASLFALSFAGIDSPHKIFDPLSLLYLFPVSDTASIGPASENPGARKGSVSLLPRRKNVNKQRRILIGRRETQVHSGQSPHLKFCQSPFFDIPHCTDILRSSLPPSEPYYFILDHLEIVRQGIQPCIYLR